ncbi:ribonuclease H-like domain-containing protein, partial [Tanacetum coccineum]
MVPRAVLMRTGLKTVKNAKPLSTVRSVNTVRPFSTAKFVNTVRPYNTAHPKPTVSCARPKTHFQNQAQRPFYKNTALTKRSNIQNINTAKQAVNTVRPNVNTVRARGFNAVRLLFGEEEQKWREITGKGKIHTGTINTCLLPVLSQEEPKRVSKALSDPAWVEAMQEELLQFKLQNVWVLVDLPKGHRAIGTKWVYRNKKDRGDIHQESKQDFIPKGQYSRRGHCQIAEDVMYVQPPRFGENSLVKDADADYVFVHVQGNRCFPKKTSHLLLSKESLDTSKQTILYVSLVDFLAMQETNCGALLQLKLYGLLQVVVDKFSGSKPIAVIMEVVCIIYKNNFEVCWALLMEMATSDNATIEGRHDSITEGSLRQHLKLDDQDGISSLPTTEIFAQLALMGYTTDSDKLTFQKGAFSPQWSNMKRSTKGFLGQDVPLFPTMLDDIEPSPSRSRITSLPSPRHTPSPEPSPTQPSPAQPSPTQPTHTQLSPTQPGTEYHPPTPHDSPIHAVYSHGSDEGSLKLQELMNLVITLSDRIGVLEVNLLKTKKTYSSSYTKLILRVKKLESQLKVGKARKQARVVLSDEEVFQDDSSKQGRKLFDEEVQEKASTDTEVFIQEVTPTEVIQDQQGSEKASDEVSTAGLKKGPVSEEVPTVSTAEVTLSTVGGTVTYS